MVLRLIKAFITPLAVSVLRDGVRRTEDPVFLRGVSEQDNSMDCGSMSYSFVGVDALIRLFAVEEVRDKLDDTRNTSGTSNENDFVNMKLANI